MKFKTDFLFNYLKEAPISLAVERSFECEIFSTQAFEAPILDIGCGDGMLASMLFDKKIDVGIGPNPVELKQAENCGKYKEVISCYGDIIPKAAGTFNTIFSNSVLEHIPEFQRVLKEAHRVLSQNGRFYVTVPTEIFDRCTVLYVLFSKFKLNVLAERYRVFFNRFWKHFNYYKKEEWENFFINSGFKIIDSKEYASREMSLINNFFVPFAFFSFIMKKITRRWLLSKKLRSLYIHPFYLIIKYFIKKYEGKGKGGLIFFSLVKAD